MKTIKKHKFTIIILAILLLAAFLRLYRISEYLTFLGDEGRDSMVAWDIGEGVGYLLQGNLKAAEEKFTLLGPNSSAGGFFYGPIYYYFITPFLWLFGGDPTGPAVMVALFGVATVYLVYKVGSEFFNRTTGILAALLYAIAPVIIVYSRSSWNPNILPFFSIALLYSLYKAVQQKSRKLFLLTGIFLGISLQLHYLTLFLGTIVLIYTILQLYKNKRLLIEYLVFILIGFIIGFAPFLLFEVRHSFPNTRALFQFILGGEDTSLSPMTLLSTWWEVFQRIYLRLPLNFVDITREQFTRNSFFVAKYIIGLFMGILATVYFLYTFVTTKSQKKEYDKKLLIFLWYLVGILLFGIYNDNIYDYHFAFLYPVPFLLLAFLFSYLLSQKNIALKVAGLGLVLFTFYANLIANPLRYTPNDQLGQTRRIAEFVLEKADGKPFNFAIISGNNSDHAYRYFFILDGNEPVTIEDQEKDPERKSITDQLFVVCESLPCDPLHDWVWKIAFFGKYKKIEDKWNVYPVEIYKIVHEPKGNKKLE